MSEGALPQRSRRVRKRQRETSSSAATATSGRRFVPVGGLPVQQFECVWRRPWPAAARAPEG